MSRKIPFGILIGVFVLSFVVGSFIAAGPAEAMDKVTLRTNWLYYGSHGIFYYGKDKGFYEMQGIALDIRQGNGSGNAVRLVANKNDTFAYASSSTMLNLAAKDAPVISVATIDATLPAGFWYQGDKGPGGQTDHDHGRGQREYLLSGGP